MKKKIIIKVGDENMIYKEVSPKIQCNVSKCMHNCIENSTCRLDSIMVCECLNDKNSNMKEDQTSCGSYKYGGNLNSSEILGGN